MKLDYQYNESLLVLNEMPNGNDVEFQLDLRSKEVKPRLAKVEEYFSQNAITTDVLVYAHKNLQFQIIVRKDFYEDFLLQLFKQQLLLELKWV